MSLPKRDLVLIWVASLSLPCLLLISSAAQAMAASGPCPSPPPMAPTSSTSPSAPEQTVVACVGSRAITQALAQHWVKVAGNSANGPASKSHSPSAHGSVKVKTSNVATANEHALIVQAMGFLISSYWVIGEAHDLHVQLSHARVHKQFTHLRKLQFPKPKEFQAFLRETGETVADLEFRVQLNLLSSKIQHRAEVGHGSSRQRQKAFSRFIAHFKRKWQAQTYCTPEYAVANCGHVQASL